VPADAGKPLRLLSIEFGPARLHIPLGVTTRHMSKSAKMWVVAGAIATIAVILAMWLLQLTGGHTWQKGVSLTITGHTNDQAGKRLVTFTLSNKGPLAISRAPFLTILGPYEIPVGETTSLIVRSTNYTLAPGQSWTTSVSAPENVARWRLAVPCVRAQRAALSTWANRVPRISNHLPKAWTFPVYEPILSDWVQQ
jgi:hypothetical protein